MLLLLLACGTPGVTTSDPVEAPVALDPCADFQPLATAEQIAATPRADAELELLALKLDESFVAEQATYDRLEADLKAIRSRYPKLAGIHGYTARHGTSIIVFRLDREALDDVVDGDHPAASCADAAYRRTDVWPIRERYVVLNFPGIVDAHALSRQYAELTGGGAEPNGKLGAGSRVCAAREGDRWLYGLRKGWGDCPSGCMYKHYYYLVSDGPGSVELRDDWGDVSAGDGLTVPPDGPRPAWIDRAWACI